MHPCGGVLLQDDPPADAAFIGVSFGAKTPVEMLQIVFASRLFPRYELLLIDEFQRMNGASKEEVNSTRRCFDQFAQRSHRVFSPSVRFETRFASSMMHQEDYRELFAATRAKVEQKKLETQLAALVPERYRHLPSAHEYALHEVACIAAFAERGLRVKVGPEKERVYDGVAAAIGIPMTYIYLVPAYALQTRTQCSVIHYSVAAPSGCRLYLEDEPRVVREKLQGSSAPALLQLAKLASASAYFRGERDKRLDEARMFACEENPHRLKSAHSLLAKTTLGMVNDHLLDPYRAELAKEVQR